MPLLKFPYIKTIWYRAVSGEPSLGPPLCRCQGSLHLVPHYATHTADTNNPSPVYVRDFFFGKLENYSTWDNTFTSHCNPSKLKKNIKNVFRKKSWAIIVKYSRITMNDLNGLFLVFIIRSGLWEFLSYSLDYESFYHTLWIMREFLSYSLDYERV